MSGKQPPFSLEAEMALIGAILLRPSIMRDLAPLVDPHDFYDPKLGHVYSACMELHAHGRPIDSVTVVAHNPDLIDARLLAEAQNLLPSTSAFARYADIVVECSRKRMVIRHAGEMIERCYDQTSDIDQVLAEYQGTTNRLIAPRSAEVAGLSNGIEFMRESDLVQDDRPWLIPHIMKALWRIILVAGEGGGKATLMRQLAVCAAAGRDPWDVNSFIEPVRTLYIDVENPAETITQQMRLACMIPGVDAVAEAGDNLFIWHREGGVNVRDRRAHAQLESVLQKVRPQIVFAGPLYKMYQRGKLEDMEQAALEFTQIIDDLRVRYDFAIVLEHHAPKASGAGWRELNPFGSSLFMRWPEVGLTMEDEHSQPDHTLDMYDMKIGRFRRDRVKCQWPSRISRGKPFQRAAWVPSWSEGRWPKDEPG